MSSKSLGEHGLRETGLDKPAAEIARIHYLFEQRGKPMHVMMSYCQTKWDRYLADMKGVCGCDMR